eukprot:TRINITY_DN1816_c0_g1_i1.p1 TRINITY_DN1816_c0_g1~~TRINITY_DN1816_c0_g1_i1.p1  ORF type:complete len:347 (-),score=44.86 TRINITY_DN1816_c0_g1_i1:341-1381(-)
MSFTVSSSILSTRSKTYIHLQRKCSLKVTCNARNNETDRRDLIIGTGLTMMGSSLLQYTPPALADGVLSVSQLSGFQKDDQRKEFLKIAQEALGKVIGGADVSQCMRLLFNDAATYDVESKTGGVDGSIILDAELNRPENSSLKPLVAKLRTAKEEIDKKGTEIGSGPISWADLIVVAARFAAKQSWFDIKLKRASNAAGGEIVASAFASEFPLDLGRIDATEPNVSGKILADDASVKEIRDFLFNLGRKEGEGEGFFSKKPPFWERPGFVIYSATRDDPAAAENAFAEYDKIYADLKLQYDRSRGTITRTDYEVDFANYFNRLANLGAKFDKYAYLHPIKTVFKL